MPSQIISSTLKRELIIIQYLYKNKGAHSMEELTKLTEVTKRIIQTDIEWINKTFPFTSIDGKSRNQIELKSSNNVGLESAYRKIMFISVEFIFLGYFLTETFDFNEL